MKKNCSIYLGLEGVRGLKKLKIGLFVLIILGTISLSLTYKNKNEVTKTKRRKQNNLAIMIKEDGTEDYIKSSYKDIPKGNYVLNRDKSYCKNNGLIGDYDNTLGKVSFSFIGTDSCYLYFDYESGKSFETVFVANNNDIFDENGLRYEGADPNNYICLDNQKNGNCSDTSLLFRIIGLFDEDTSSDGTNSSGSKKLLKVIDTNNYGGASGKYWNSAGTNNWSTASLKTEINGTYLTTLLGTSNVNSKLSSVIVNAKWHLGAASSSNHQTLTAEGIYTQERDTSAIYSGNPTSIYAQVGLMYPSDYGYATVGGTTTNKSSCRALPLNNWAESYSDCINDDWLFTSQSSFVNSGEWLLSPFSSNSKLATKLNSGGDVKLKGDKPGDDQFAVRLSFYLDSSVLKIVGGTGTSSNPYRIG